MGELAALHIKVLVSDMPVGINHAIRLQSFPDLEKERALGGKKASNKRKKLLSLEKKLSYFSVN